ncbi:MAG: PglZ domain-containing protein [Flavobacteriales bacterium]|nr:PglZ domain-containing protein [Flavobacteriales bacterium]
MEKVKILWADDEIELLKPHIMFLEEKGYDVATVNNGMDALDTVKDSRFDIVFLDENMPGYTGLEILAKIKEILPSLPVIMITKSEEEHIMEGAIGSKISDYLIKPVNPNQILLSIKKNLDKKRLQSETATSKYQQEFRQIGMTLSDRLDWDEWVELYKKLVYWELELDQSNDPSMNEILLMQKNDANNLFCKYIESNYVDWLSGSSDAPIMSHNLIKKGIFDRDFQCDFLIVIDNLRYDQWRIMRPIINEYFRIEDENLYCSILPTATQYARNSLFAGLLPSDIQKLHSEYWVNENEDAPKNNFESELLGTNLKRLGRNVRYNYEKITNIDNGKKLVDQFQNLLNFDFNAIVYNFVDMLSHARTDMRVVRELADDEAAYRSLTKSWFEHSPLLDLFKKIAESGKSVFVTTDHGTVHVDNPVKVVGDRETSTNLRYKQGRNLQFDASDVFAPDRPEDVYLPKINVSSKYIFSKNNDFFAYPNNYNHYVKYYRNTFQHGGISMEEMLIPYIHLSAR